MVVGSFGLLIGSRGRSKGTAGAWQPARGRGTELSPVLSDCQSFVALCRRESGKTEKKDVLMSAWMAPKSRFQDGRVAWEGSRVKLSCGQSRV